MHSLIRCVYQMTGISMELEFMCIYIWLFRRTKAVVESEIHRLNRRVYQMTGISMELEFTCIYIWLFRRTKAVVESEMHRLIRWVHQMTRISIKLEFTCSSGQSQSSFEIRNASFDPTCPPDYRNFHGTGIYVYINNICI